MKHFFIFLLLLCPFWVGAAPWSAMADYAAPREDVESAERRPGERYLLPQVLQGRPVRVFLSTEDGKNRKYEKLVQDTYNRWFTETAAHIRRVKRETDFADLLPLLEQGIAVEWATVPEEADIEISFIHFEKVLALCGSHSIGCYKRLINGRKRPGIYLPKDEFWLWLLSFGKLSAKRIGQHEIGHSLGLSDQYEFSRDNNSHQVYHAPVYNKSVMRQGGKLSCDDAEGIINLIDITQGTSRGGEQGWESFCHKKLYYVNGAVKAGNEYVIEPIKAYSVWRVETYRRGQRIQWEDFPLAPEGYFPFTAVQETAEQYDKWGRPLYARGVGGESIFYSYTYDACRKLTVLDGQVVRAEIFFPRMSKNKKHWFTLVYFGNGGHSSQIGSAHRDVRDRDIVTMDKRGFAFYELDINDDKRDPEIWLDFDEEGRVIKSIGSDTDGLSLPGGGEPLDTCMHKQLTVRQLKNWYLAQ